MSATDALSIAAAAVQFFDFSTKVLSSAWRMYESGSGMTVDGEDIDAYVQNLGSAILNLRAQNVTDQELLLLVGRCERLGDDIVNMVRRSAITSTNKVKRYFKVLGQSIRYAWKKEDIEEKMKRLDQLKGMMFSRFTSEQLE